MTLYLEASGKFVSWDGQAIAAVRHPLAIEQAWSLEQLADVGLYQPDPADPIPDDKISTGQTVRRVDGAVKFVHTLINKPQLTLAERRADLLPRLAQKRWEVETGGVEVMGINVRTDEVGQSKLTGAIVAMGNDETLTQIDWEAQPGVWVTLDVPTISGLSYVVARHVQACFSRARVVSEAIQAAGTHATMDEVQAQIDIGWP